MTRMVAYALVSVLLAGGTLYLFRTKRRAAWQLLLGTIGMGLIAAGTWLQSHPATLSLQGGRLLNDAGAVTILGSALWIFLDTWRGRR
jgi:hypothetical protein